MVNVIQEKASPRQGEPRLQYSDQERRTILCDQFWFANLNHTLRRGKLYDLGSDGYIVDGDRFPINIALEDTYQQNVRTLLINFHHRTLRINTLGIVEMQTDNEPQSAPIILSPGKMEQHHIGREAIFLVQELRDYFARHQLTTPEQADNMFRALATINHIERAFLESQFPQLPQTRRPSPQIIDLEELGVPSTNSRLHEIGRNITRRMRYVWDEFRTTLQRAESLLPPSFVSKGVYKLTEPLAIKLIDHDYQEEPEQKPWQNLHLFNTYVTDEEGKERLTNTFFHLDDSYVLLYPPSPDAAITLVRLGALGQEYVTFDRQNPIVNTIKQADKKGIYDILRQIQEQFRTLPPGIYPFLQDELRAITESITNYDIARYGEAPSQEILFTLKDYLTHAQAIEFTPDPNLNITIEKGNNCYCFNIYGTRYIYYEDGKIIRGDGRQMNPFEEDLVQVVRFGYSGRRRNFPVAAAFLL